ncbi:hypothetical protein [Streptomyces erythrochromogenes]|uniref:hypothetical protein n=1 Tax=Streptomyces erythrochromogenes TaxID=285574 RepID=UPI003864DFF7|nr:DUF5129 domain-containing protein [Streptomyces erythrochromogenes]
MSSVLTVWWATSPLALVAAGRLSPLAPVLVWVAFTGVVVAPVAGLVLAYAGGHTRARRRFAVMSAVSLAVCFLVYVFWQFAMECRPGEPSCSP